MSQPSTSSSINEKNNEIIFNEILNQLNVNKINEKDIKLKKSLARGGQGKIKQGLFKNLDVIVKVLPKENIMYIIYEISNMIKYKNVNIPKFLGVFENEKYFGLVMEYIEGLNLSKIISLENQGKITLSLIQKLNYLIQLSSVMDYLNSNNLIHRDLKTDNILVDKLGQLKLIDFGISLQGKRIWIDANSPYYSLTPNYMAPEIVNQEENESDIKIKQTKNGNYIIKKNNKDKEDDIDEKRISDDNNDKEKWILITDKYDVWTFGIIMCQLFTRCRPWCKNVKENICEYEIQMKLIAKVPYPVGEFYPIDECKNYKNEIKTIIINCLNYEQEKRPSMKIIKEDLLKIYSKICNEKSIIVQYNQMRLNRLKNYEKNNNVLKINKKGNDNNSEELLFPKFRNNRINNYSFDNRKDKIVKDNKNDLEINESISLFKDKILNKIVEDNISLKHNILIKKSIIQNDLNLKINNIK
jgi:serine/threonine protein kinase